MALLEIKLPHVATYNFGVGLDRLSGTAMNLAVKPTLSQPMLMGGIIESFDVSRVSSTQDLQQKLGIDVNASYGCASFGAGVSARFSFAQESVVHSATLFMTVTASAHLADLSIVEAVLTDPATTVVNKPDIFQQRYGDSFARASSRGGLFVGLMRVETFDDTEATSIEAELRGSYGLFSADASAKFSQVTTQHNASVYCSIYTEGGPAIQMNDPTDPKELLSLANQWLQAMHDQPDANAVPYEWTFSPLTIAEGPLPLNAAQIQSGQDVLKFCAQQRAALLDQLNLLSWWVEHQNRYDWSESAGVDQIVAAAANTQKDLDTIAACASAAINDPAQAKMPADFAPTQQPPNAQHYPISQPLPKGPKALPAQTAPAGTTHNEVPSAGVYHPS